MLTAVHLTARLEIFNILLSWLKCKTFSRMGLEMGFTNTASKREKPFAHFEKRHSCNLPHPIIWKALQVCLLTRFSCNISFLNCSCHWHQISSANTIYASVKSCSFFIVAAGVAPFSKLLPFAPGPNRNVQILMESHIFQCLWFYNVYFSQKCTGISFTTLLWAKLP